MKWIVSGLSARVICMPLVLCFVLVGCKPDSKNTPVTAENYVQAETDWNFSAQQAKAPINTWLHQDPVTEKNQTIIRSNADVLYSFALVDVSKGATLSIPERKNGKLQLIHYIDENHLTHGVIFAGESVTLTPKDLTGGNYIYILARTRISDDLDETKAAQRAMVIDAKSATPYPAKGFDPKEVVAFREKLIKEVYSGKVALDGFHAFGATRDDVNPSDYYYGAAVGWGGLPPQYAQYTSSVKGQGSAARCQTITFPKPNLDYAHGGFFSLTTYNSDSWIEGDNFYIGMDRMKDNGDGTMTIDFNCDTSYSVTVGEGWNGTFRLYKPVDVEETRKAVEHLMEIPIQLKEQAESATVPVTLENYEVAESDLAFHNITKLVGTGKFYHFPVTEFDLDNQTVVRMNQDTVYSAAILNVSEGGSVTLPETDGRYMTAMVVQNDHYIDQVFKTPGTHEIKADTDFVMLAVRTRINMNDPADREKVRALQKAMQVSSRATSPHVMPNYDMEQLVALRDKLAAEAASYGSLNNMQGAHGTVDKHMHLLGTAAGWGLLPDANARYLTYGQQDGQGCYTAHYTVPPFNKPGFFSITMYDADGWMFSDRAILNEYNLTFNKDGTFDVNFGDCGEDAKNNLPIVDGWNFLMRVYEPKLAELDQYKLPTPVKVK
eukprot:TRINITY_DN23517_c0_g1_i1.p1 TRINITY_DN23517_c0_g1~~TRINITY_DN23517_c0_g1_i1.p1  ORF type:complete len:662 (-),score=131.68 TRINITY_DN23517_c0_g1_i1:942-2927(-)